MTTELYRKRMLQSYREFRAPDLFLSGFFQVRARNIFDCEKVNFDVKRLGEQISPVVATMTGDTYNSSDVFTTKEWTPPSFEEGAPFNANDLLKRAFGENEYDSTDMSFMAQLVERIMESFQELEAKINRTIEVQASQVLQTGTLSLKNQKGDATYTVDFFPKPTHFPTAGTAWNAGGADPLGDLEALADVIRDDSTWDADLLIMGSSAFDAFLKNDDVQKFFDNRRIEVGNIRPEVRGNGGKFQGFVSIGNYRFDIWTYNGRYQDIGESTKTKYVSDGNVIMLSSGAPLDKVFGGVPRVVDVDPRFADILPSRVSMPSATDFSPNIYATPNGKQLIIELASRPMCIPTAIDSYGTLDTGTGA